MPQSFIRDSSRALFSFLLFDLSWILLIGLPSLIALALRRSWRAARCCLAFCSSRRSDLWYAPAAKIAVRGKKLRDAPD